MFSVLIGITSSHMRPVVCVFDIGVALNLIKAKVPEHSCLQDISQRNNPEI